MVSVCLYFQIHQPFRLRRYSVFDSDQNYFDDYQNGEICRKVAQHCYMPANLAMLETIRAHEGKFRFAFSITGTALEQFERYVPEVIRGFQQLAETGCVEFLEETYYHSLAFLYSRTEFRDQIELHRKKIKELFNQEPRVFRNTELIYNNDLAQFISKMGYDGVLADGSDQLLGTRSPNLPYTPASATKLRLLLKNYRLSEDISHRFSNRNWEQWPLTADKFANWINQVNGNGTTCNLFMDYETFGERQPAETGIFDFLRHLPAHVLRQGNNFLTPAQIVDQQKSGGEIDCPHMMSSSDSERDLSVWLGNAMQTNALQELYKLEAKMKERGDEALLADWRRLSTSDHFYYMCTKFWSSPEAQKYFSPYESPYDSYINYMNVLDNITSRLRG
ncbi:MAG TPA: glycoside hydrolase family 57 protein [Tepidisphaeraceae bacterium]|jgi:alpha-amylase